MKFLADENIEKPIVDRLRHEGFDVRYIAEEARSFDDDRILAWANQEDRILLTNDKDFGQKRVRTGIVLLRFRREEAEWKAQRLVQFLKQYRKPLTGKFVVLRDASVRARPMQNRGPGAGASGPCVSRPFVLCC